MAAIVTTMPLLVLTLGSEMAHILRRQMRDKKVPRDRRQRVLRDVLRALHDPTFTSALFQQQRLPSLVSIRALFGRLANASPSLSVNAMSMDRLYDLMRLHVKEQILAMASADELLQVVMNHLESCREIFEDDDDEDTARFISETIVVTAEAFEDFRPGDWFLAKQLLCRFLQEVKAKSFATGHVELLQSTHTATGGRIPGDVRYYDEEGCIDREEYFVMTNGENVVAGSRVPIMERNECATLLGQWEPVDGSEIAGKSARVIVENARKAVRGDQSEKKATRREFDVFPGRDFDLLAELIGTSAKACDENQRPLSLNFFDDSKDDEEDLVPTVWIDARSESKETDTRFDAFFDSKEDTKREDDDLLRLMDSMT